MVARRTIYKGQAFAALEAKSAPTASPKRSTRHQEVVARGTPWVIRFTANKPPVTLVAEEQCLLNIYQHLSFATFNNL